MEASKMHFWRLNDANFCATFVHSENGLGSRFRLQLRPQLINLNEIFRKCGHDTNLNLQSTAVFTNMNQLPQMAHFKCQET